MLRALPLLLLVLLVRPAISDDRVKAPSEESSTDTRIVPRDARFYTVKKSEGAVGFEYYRFMLIKIGNTTYALHVLPDPRFGHGQGITYRWYSTKDGSDRFISNVRRSDSDGAIPHHELALGSGETYEIDYGIGLVTVGRTKLQWSVRNGESGWLYFRNTDKAISIYAEQFDAFADFSQRLDESRWIQMSVAKSSTAKQSDSHGAADSTVSSGRSTVAAQ